MLLQKFSLIFTQKICLSPTRDFTFFDTEFDRYQSPWIELKTPSSQFNFGTFRVAVTGQGANYTEVNGKREGKFCANLLINLGLAQKMPTDSKICIDIRIINTLKAHGYRALKVSTNICANLKFWLR